MPVMANVNGRLCAQDNAFLSVFDHGFLYGEGVYETLRSYNRWPFLFGRHLRRLRTSASMIELNMPFTDEDLSARVLSTMDAADPTGEVYLRILLTRGPGELTYDLDPSAPTSVVIIARPFTPPAEELYEQGVAVSFVSLRRSHPNSLNPLIKSNNLLLNAMALREAQRRGAFEGLMLNWRGEITECSQSNFFIVRGGELVTPPLDSGILAGITREFVIETAVECRVPVHETAVNVSDVLTADEAFLSSSTREIVPIVRIDGHTVTDGRPGPVTRQLLNGFRRRADALSRQTG